MAQSPDLRALALRLTALRADLLNRYPFFGRLLLHLQFGYAACGTAYTDMRKVVFDPEFAACLSDEELRFVLLHELLHCVLHHCTRGRSLHHELYNIACDIVVNSIILEILCLPSFRVDGEEAMHLAPNGREGREYAAEQVYEMLLRGERLPLSGGAGGSFRDTHEPWADIDPAQADDAWEQHIRSAARQAGSGSGIPYGMRRYLREVEHCPTANWRMLLQDFIRHDRSDFVFAYPDHRYQGDVILPSFRENVYGERVDQLWFFVDTSGSISDEALSEAFLQIRQAMEQLDALSGQLAFFDSELSDFFPISSVEELYRLQPVGGGGTSFGPIFRALEGISPEELPVAIVILTDGCAAFPQEEAARGIPVLWVITDEGPEPPWGTVVRI